MQRRPSTQDVSWLIDLHRNGQIDLDPPYQRRSVWTRKDRQFFLDTIFRNYPSPAIFLHKTISDDGRTTYHVVDGKQRTETILDFVNGNLRLASDFGDMRLDGKRWDDLDGDLKRAFWNYQLTIEQIDVLDGSLVNEVFDRLNRNSRKLTRQEMRHAKYDGWFISEAENEATREEWSEFGVVTRARVRRMADVQFVSELMLVVLEHKVMGFDQNLLDELYAKYEEPQDTVPEFDEDQFRRQIDGYRDILREMENHNRTISENARALANFYTLWCVLVLEESLPEAISLAERYTDFMAQVDIVGAQSDITEFLQTTNATEYSGAIMYFNNIRGANTDYTPRAARYQALRDALIQNSL